MVKQMYTLTDAVSTNTLLEFISTYFPFIDETLKLKYRGRTYKIISTKARKFEFENFFISHNCFKCTFNCCKGMYIPIGFEQFWPEDKLKAICEFKFRKYSVQLNDRNMTYYIGEVGRSCKYQIGKSCTIWDSNKSIQIRPMGCHYYPMTWYWEEGTTIFTKYCDPYFCKAESTLYTVEDLNHDLITFKRLSREIEMIGLSVNYRPVEALKNESYLSI